MLNSKRLHHLLHWALLVTIVLTKVYNSQAIDGLNDDPNKQSFDKFRELIKRILLGDLWGFDKYCGLERSDRETIKDDTEIRSLFNGTNLAKLNSSAWPDVLEKLHNMNEINLKARTTMPVVCSSSSWGYADNNLQLLSDGPSVDFELCLKEIKNLIEFAQTKLQFHLHTPSAKRVANNFTSSSIEFNPTLWLQLQTFGRLPPGASYKNHLWLGDYEGCLEVGNKLLASNQDSNKQQQRHYHSGTRYCFGSYGRSVHKSGEFESEMLLSNGNEKHKSNYSKRGVRLGLCLPRSCSSNLLAQQQLSSGKNHYLNKLDTLIKLNLKNDYYSFLGEGHPQDEAIKEQKQGGNSSSSSSSTSGSAYKLLALYCPPTDDSKLRSFLPGFTSGTDQSTTTIINSFLLLLLPLVWFSTLLYASTIKRNVEQRQQHCHYCLKSCNHINKTTTTTTVLVGDKKLAVEENKMPTTATTLNCNYGQTSEKTKLDELLQKLKLVVVQSFDLRLNHRDFLSETNDSVKKLAGLNAIKVLSMNWLMITHIYLLNMSYSSDLQAFQKRASIVGVFLLNGQSGVHVFFIISGLLFGYKFFNKKQQQQHLNINYFQIIVLRYLRFAPMYLLCYSYIKQFSHLLGSGPLWDYGVSLQSDSRQCRNESWLIPLLMIANFIQPFNQCIITGWHIANDVQIVFLLPFLLHAYGKSVILGRIFACSLFVLTHYAHILQWAQSNNYQPLNLIFEPFIFGPRYVVDRLSYGYVSPFCRIGTYTLGLLLAEVLFSKNNRDQKLAKNIEKKIEFTRTEQQETSIDGPESREIKDLAATVAAAAAVESSVEEIEKNRGYENFKVITLFAIGIFLWMGVFSLLTPNDLKSLVLSILPYPSLAYPLNRFGMEIGWAILLYFLLKSNDEKSEEMITANKSRVHFGKSLSVWQTKTILTPIGHFLKLPIWNVLVKLNYSIMLTHFTLAKWMIQTQTQLIQFTWTNFAQFTLYYLFVTYLLNTIVHLIVEVPLNRMVKLLTLKMFAKT